MLFEELMEPFVLLAKTTQADGYGGQVTLWTEGSTFNASIAPDDGRELLTAMQAGWNGSYTVITHKTITLMYGDVIRRESDGKLFRIRSDGTDSKTPGSASLDIRAVKAEGYTLG